MGNGGITMAVQPEELTRKDGDRNPQQELLSHSRWFDLQESDNPWHQM